MSAYLAHVAQLRTALSARPDLKQIIDEVFNSHPETSARPVLEGENRSTYQIGQIELGGSLYGLALKLPIEAVHPQVDEWALKELGAFDCLYDFMNGQENALTDAQQRHLKRSLTYQPGVGLGSSRIPLDRCHVPFFHAVALHKATGHQGVLCQDIGPHKMVNLCQALTEAGEFWFVDLKNASFTVVDRKRFSRRGKKYGFKANVCKV